MKRFLAIFFLFTFLTANTAFGEILRLPILVHHYIEHTQEDKDASFINFIALHYGGNIEHQHKENHHDHEKLPFKTANCHASQVVTLAFQPFFSLAQIIFEPVDEKITISSQQNYSNSYLNSIWQPPRFS